MKEAFIKNYINGITTHDIKDFATKNNISLSDEETIYLYNTIKREWYNIIFGDPNPILKDLQNHFDSNRYQQLYQLYQMYKNKYSHYL